MFGEYPNIAIRGIASTVPVENVENLDCISKELTEKKIRKQIRLTGIERRRILTGGQTASDLATKAADELLNRLNWNRDTRTKKSASCKSKIFSLFIHFLCNEEIFLFRSYRCTDTFHIIISKQMKNTKRLLIQSFHRTKQRSFFIQCLSAIGTERCRNT